MECGEVLGGEEEGVGELVFIGEDCAWESEVGV